MNLTENSLKVLQARYLKKNEKGEICETPEELFRRVAKAVAEPESKYGKTQEEVKEIEDQFFDMMTNSSFMPNSPTLMNAGREMGMLSACIHGDSPVLTSTGYIPMKEVVRKFLSGEEVIVSNGFNQWVPVLGAKSNGIKDVYRVHTNSGRTVESTLDHKFWSCPIKSDSRKKFFTWKKLEEINEGDYLHYGQQSMPELKGNAVEVDEAILAAWTLTDGGCGLYTQTRGTGDFFVGEIQVIDQESLNYVSSVLKRLQIKFSEREDTDVGNVEMFVRLRSSDRVWMKLCEKYELFERGVQKHVSALIKQASSLVKKEFLKSVFEADGWICKNGIGYCSCSQTLAHDISRMLDEFGVPNQLKFIKERRVGRLNSWKVMICHSQAIKLFRDRIGFISDRKNKKLLEYPELKNCIYKLNIEEIEFIGQDEVFDIQTAPDGNGSFVVDGIIVHNCFVLPVEDSIDGIFDSIKHTALIQKSGGGTGFSFSKLRPKGDIVKSSGGTTSGPISFLKVFSQATEAIQQGAFRRGANMGVMRIDHPDIIEFIEVKKDLTQLTNYNLSVAVTDEFMTKLKLVPDQIHIVTNPRSKESYELRKSNGGYYTVKEVWQLILDRAWETGEPGILFIDRANEYNPTPHIGEYEATNPCGEQWLLPYEACNLGSINLSKFVITNLENPYFDFVELRCLIETCIRFLDNTIDANKYPLPKITELCHNNRKIGLGVMGFADALYKMNIPYNSDEGVAFGESVMRFIQNESHKSSEQLAIERGVFPNFKGSRWDTEWKQEVRNACLTTVAPTGTISIIANCSGGIEPMFSLVFQRNVLNGQKLTEVNEVFASLAKEKGFYSEELVDHIAQKGTIQDLKYIPEDVRKVFVTARDIAPEWHLRMQAAFQRHCDSSISKTINFDNTASKDDIKSIYQMAYDLKLKGVTIYRDGCRQNQPMTLKEEKKLTQQTPIKVPEIMPSVKVRQVTPFGNMHIQITVDINTQKELEVFAQLGKGGDLASSDLEAICRLMSLHLRTNGDFKLAIAQLDGIGSSLSIPSKEGRIQSLADGLAKGLQKYLNAKELFGLESILLGKSDISKLPEEKQTKKVLISEAFKIKCPECEGTLSLSEGCMMCHSCGYSKC